MSGAAARPEWQVAAGSVRGTRHRHAERNNQDACFWDAHGDVLALCVADGCSASAHSEAGALLGVRSAVRHMLRVVAELPCATAQTIVAETCTRIGSDIDRLAEMVGRSPEAVYAHLLFTLVGAIVTSERAFVWALGDGVVIVNGDVTVLESENNQPLYAAYSVLDGVDRTPAIIWQGPAAGLQSLLIGTDGVHDLIRAARRPLPGQEHVLGEIAQFWTDDVYFRNPDQIRRRLALANRAVRRPDWASRPLLPDDTTLIVIRRLQSRPHDELDTRHVALEARVSL